MSRQLIMEVLGSGALAFASYFFVVPRLRERWPILARALAVTFAVTAFASLSVYYYIYGVRLEDGVASSVGRIVCDVLNFEACPDPSKRDILLRADREEWAKATTDHTVASYNRYLERFPTGRNVDTAKRIINELVNLQVIDREAKEAETVDDEAWRSRQSLDTIDAYANYLSIYPLGRHAGEANRRLFELRQEVEVAASTARDDAAWDLAISRNTDLSYRHYLNSFPTGRHAPEANSAIEKLQENAKTIEIVTARAKTISQLFKNGTVAFYRRDLQAVIEYMNKIIDLEGTSANAAKAFHNRGCAYLEVGDRAAAADDFRTALAINPELTKTRQNLNNINHMTSC